MPNQPLEFRLSNEKRDHLFIEIGKMLKQKVVLQQTLREQKEQASSFSEDIFLELLEVVDALQFLLDYLVENPNPSPELIGNMPNSLAAVQKKFLSVLAKRQLHQLEITGTKPDFSICKVIDCEVRNDLEESTITKVVRRGFRFGDKVIRPIEVITSKKNLSTEVLLAVPTEGIIQNTSEIANQNVLVVSPEEVIPNTPEIANQDLLVVSPAEVIQDNTYISNEDLPELSSEEVIPQTPEIANQNLLVVSPAEVIQDNTYINNEDLPELSSEEVIPQTPEIANQNLLVVSPAEVIQDNTYISNEDLSELSPEEIIQEIQEIANQDLSVVSDEEVIQDNTDINTENLAEVSNQEIIQEITEIEEIAQAMPETGENFPANDA
ncbi:MAG TPA: nucleotide exchange factor GrpE [Oculatellaceae cyanobacterium]|jgi:molecular chaperone GrpE